MSDWSYEKTLELRDGYQDKIVFSGLLSRPF